MSHFDETIPVQTIIAGKLRRYHHVSMARQLLWPSLVLPNVRDAFKVGAGFIQSFCKLLVWRPDVIFTKGGYVCLPVGIAARALRIPLVIHDSDAHPGLTNRVLGKWATNIATGAPLKYYSYPADRSHYVGIPISRDFVPLEPAQKAAVKQEWQLRSDRPLIVVTGGGLGATRMNDAVIAERAELEKLGSVLLVSGQGQFEELRAQVPEDTDTFRLQAFISSGMAAVLGAASVVVARAGATTTLELAALATPTILVPNGKLTGGHQLKNAAVYAEKDAVVIVDEADMVPHPEVLTQAVAAILGDATQAEAMGRRFQSFARPDAARDTAQLILGAIRTND